jgi:hypothetical protein
MGKQIVLRNVQINWPRIAVAEKNQNFPANAPTYNIMALVPKGHAGHAELQVGIDEATAMAVQAGKKSPSLPTTWEPKANGSREIRATAQETWNRQVVDEAMNTVDPALTRQKFYSGAFCNVAVDVYYSSNYNKVCFGLLAVQFVNDGDRLDNQPAADELFSPIEVSGQQPDPLG